MSADKIKELQRTIDQLLDQIDQIDDPVVKKRLMESLQTHIRKLHDENEGDERMQLATTTLEDIILKLTEGTNSVRIAKADVAKTLANTVNEYLLENK